MTRFFNARLVAILAVLIAGASIASRADAVILNVDVDVQGDIHTYTGAAAIGSPGDDWNSLPTNSTDLSFTASSLVQADGVVTPVSVTISSTNSTPFAALDTAGPDDGDLLRDTIRVGFGDGAPNMNIVINNLRPDSSYDLYLYSTIEGSWGGNFTFDGVTKLATGANPSGFVEGENYVEFAGLNSGTGTISGVLSDGRAGIYGVLDGLQIEGESFTPEPTSLALAGAAFPLLLRRRRRR